MLSLYVGLDIRIVPNSNITAELYGDSTFTAKNIPSGFDGITLPFGYVVVHPTYHRIPVVNTQVELEDLFVTLIALPYMGGQTDPNVIFDIGGDCQAYAIYLRTYLERKGYENGFLPTTDHVCNWAVIDDVVYKLDVTTKAFTQASPSELKRIEPHRR